MTEDKFFFEREVFSNSHYKFKFEEDKELIKEILKFKKSGNVLDLGCGEGGTALTLAKRGFNVTCIDISKTAINKIRKKAEKERIKINAICGDLEDYKIIEEYDLIIGGGVFHFLSKEKAIELIKKAKIKTKLGGINIFEVLLEGDPSQENDSEGYYFRKNELKNLYSDWKIENYEEYEDYDKEMNWNNKLAEIIAMKK